MTPGEVQKIIDGLKSKKAPGIDGITAEHIKFGGEKLLEILTCICNTITRTECIPRQLKRGIIIPIPKGTKDVSIQNNNRGITLVSVVVKIYQKAVLSRHLAWSDTHDKIDDMQGVGQPKSSSIHTAWLLRETVAANTEQDSSVYVALIDTTKAFDTVWVQGLFQKLMVSNMDSKVWRILFKFYNDFRCSVQIGGVLSEWFKSGQGVHQGEPWSMYLYTKMINNLLVRLRSMKSAAKISLLYTGTPSYADDIAIVTLHKPLLQRLLDCAYEYSQKWRFEFNASKTELIIFGKDLCPDLDIKLGGDVIKVKNGGWHMGVPLTDSAQYEAQCIQEKIDSGKRAYFSIQGLGNKYLPVPPVVSAKLYWSVCVPRMTHGLEISMLSDSSMSKLEQAHGHMAKCIQGLPSQTPNSACIAPLNWSTMEGYIDKLKILFLWRLLLMTTNCIYKQVAI